METHIGMGWGMVEQGGWRKGPWTSQEDRLLIQYVKLHGEGRWNSVATLVGLKRNGKSCRLRWVNYLRPDLRKGQITPYEESIIIELHARWGNRWSTIARSLPGRTDNEIKNYWRTHFKKKTNSCSNDMEKSKTRILKKQLFQQQQQQYHYELQQQQQALLQNQHQFDLKKMVSLLGDNENEVATIIPQAKEEVFSYASMCPTNEGQGSFYSMFDNNDTSTSQSSNEDLLWDEFWNMDDVQGNNWSAMCATNKVGMHNFVAPLC